MIKLKLSQRLLTIADIITDNNKVIDVGCDHADLDIFLALNRQNVYCIAVDNKENIVNNVREKIKKYQLEDKIKVYQSNGLENIEFDKDFIIVLAGLGTKTIIKILTQNPKKLTNTLIIQSNNDIVELRKKIIKLGYYIEDEKYIQDRHKNYVIIKFIYGQKKYKKLDYILGPILKHNLLYVENIIKKYTFVLEKLPKKYWFKRLKIKYLIYQIKKGYFLK